MTIDHNTLLKLADRLSAEAYLSAAEIEFTSPKDRLRRGYLAGRADTYTNISRGIRDYLTEYGDLD